MYKQVVAEGYVIVEESQRVVAAQPAESFSTGLSATHPKAVEAKKAKKTMNTETTTTLENANAQVEGKKPVKKAVKKATKKVVATKTTKKTIEKGAKKEKTEVVKAGIGKVHLICLRVLDKSKTVVYPGLSGKGELKYAQLAAEGEVAVNNLTQVMAASSTKGTEYPNSLASLGLADCKTYEKPDGGSTSWLWFITPKGREFLKNLPKGV
jgi:hypothetical protein